MAALRIICLVLLPVSSPMGTSHDPVVSAVHSSEHSCYSKHRHQCRETSLSWHRKLPAHLSCERKFTLFSSALLITETDWIRRLDLQQNIGKVSFRQEKAQLSYAHQTYFSMCKSSFLCFICYNNACLPTYFLYFHLCLHVLFSRTVFLAEEK